MTFTIPPDIYEKFRAACGIVPMSRIVEILIIEWLAKVERDEKRGGGGGGVIRVTPEFKYQHAAEMTEAKKKAHR